MFFLAGFAFLCPNGTLFNQEVFVCDWYQHVDCSTSENHYSKNAALNMKIDNMSDMMAVVNEMMAFPLKTNVSRPKMLPNIGIPAERQTTRAPFVATTPFQSTSPTTQNQKPITITLPSSQSPTTSNQFGSRIPRPQASTEGTPKQQQPNAGFGTKTITQEGDIEFNSKSETDRIKTNKETTFSNQPIFISSLGELSTDDDTKFDINKAKIIKPEENTVFTPPTVSKEEQEKNQIKQSLSESFNNRENKQGLTVNSDEQNLLQGLQRALEQNPYAVSGEDDLLQFVQKILQKNPDLSADQLNAILSDESDAILQVLNDAQERNKNTGNGQSGKSAVKSGENDILASLQNILNKRKNNQKSVGSPASNKQIPVESGESDLLQTLQRILKQAQVPIFSGEADLLQFIQRLEQQNPDFTAKELNAIISGEADSILRFLNEKRKSNNGFAVSSGEADLLEAIQQVLQKYRSNGTKNSLPIPVISDLLQPPFETGLSVENQQRQADATTESILDKNRFSQPTSNSDQMLNQRKKTDDSLNQAFFNQNANNIRNNVNANKPVSTTGALNINAEGRKIPLAGVNSFTQAPQNAFSPVALPLKPSRFPSENVDNRLQPIDSGEADLIETIRMIALRIPNKPSPVFSGEADLLQFIQRIKQQNRDISTNQLNAIISGEANSILRILNEKSQQNQNGLLEAIQNFVDKYRQNGEGLAPPLPELMFSGEKDLLNTLQNIQQQSRIPIFSGEADLLQFIRRIEQQHPNLTPSQLNAIISGESDSILRILNEKSRTIQNNGDAISSGEADLFEAIQQVLQKYKNRSSAGSSSSGEKDLQQTLQRIQQQSRIPIFSGEADLVQFIERIQQRNPDFTLKELNVIISGEADSILQILNEKSQRNRGIAVSSGEADLLQAIQLVLDKYRGKNQSSTQPQSLVVSGDAYLRESLQNILQQSSTPIFSGEADLLQFIELIKQNNPEFTTDQLSAIISGESNSILQNFSEISRKNQNKINSGQADLLEAIQLALQKYKNTSSSSSVDSDEINLIQSLRRVQEQSARSIFSGDAEISEFSKRLHQQNPDLTSKQLSEIIANETNSIVQILKEKEQKAVDNDFEPNTGEDDLLVAVQYYVEQYVKFENTTTSTGAPQPAAVFSGESDLLQSLQRIREQSPVPIFSGEADLVQFIERIKQRHPEFTSNQLNAIISGEADLISQILREKLQNKQSNGIAIESGEADLLEAIEIVLQKYRGTNDSSPPQSAANVPNSTPNVFQSSQKPIDDSNFVQTIKYFGQQIRVPIFSGEADLVQFIERIKQRNPEFTSNQLNSIILSEADSILQLLNQKIQRKQIKGIAITSGQDDLLETIQEILQKYKSVNVQQTSPSSIISGSSGQLSLVASGESDLLQALRRIQQESAVPIFSGEADLVQFIEQIKQTNADLTENQLAAIISGESNSILALLNEKGQSVSSGEAELFSAIYQVLQRYRQNNQNSASFTSNQFGNAQANFPQNTQTSLDQTKVSAK